jgi:hypothetical protein
VNCTASTIAVTSLRCEVRVIIDRLISLQHTEHTGRHGTHGGGSGGGDHGDDAIIRIPSPDSPLEDPSKLSGSRIPVGKRSTGQPVKVGYVLSQPN